MFPSEGRSRTNLDHMKWDRRILVVEDEPLLASLISESLAQAGFTTFTSADALTAREEVVASDPDAVLIDINLGSGPSGLQLAQWIHRTHPHVALIFLSQHVDPSTVGQENWEVPAGSAFLSKDRISDTRTLINAIEATLHQSESIPRHDLETISVLSKLTQVQLEILRLASLGLTNSAIATRRNTSSRTVEQRLQTVYESLGIHITPDINPRAKAIRMFIEAGGLAETGEQFA